MMVCLATGCSTVAKMGLKTMQGVKTHAIEIDAIPVTTLDPYQTLTVGSVTTDVGPICPVSLVSEVNSQLIEACNERLEDVFSGGDKSMTIDVVCRFYKKKSLIGKEGRLDLLVTMLDTSTRQQIGRFYVEGITESPLHTGEDSMAKGLAKGVAKHLKKLKEGDSDEEEDDEKNEDTDDDSHGDKSDDKDS